MRSLESKATTLGAAGAGSVVLGPVPAWETWTLARITVRTDDHGTGATPSVIAYEGSAEGGRILSASPAGSSNTDDFPTPIDVAAGHYVTVAWSGGNPGSRATAHLFGNRRRGA